jgi:hypothetical protein
MVRLRQLLWIVIVCSTVFLNCALAQTALTQIQDTVHNPDGTLFSGTVNISFNGLAVPGTIAPQNTSAQIYTGALSVLLTPTTTAAAGAYYQAQHRVTQLEPGSFIQHARVGRDWRIGW